METGRRGFPTRQSRECLTADSGPPGVSSPQAGVQMK
jgi:hypothetical protein